MDDITTLAQDSTGAEILLNAIQEFSDWSNMQLNLGKTVVIDQFVFLIFTTRVRVSQCEELLVTTAVA
jgi:hypothetical protein